MINNKIIKVKNLNINFNKHMVIDNLSVSFDKGEAVLITGRNGSGKTTFLKCLGGVLFPDSGLIRFGNKVSKKKIGIISDKMSLFEDYTLEQGIVFHSEIFGIDKFNFSLINQLNLKYERKIKTLSAGERAIYHLSLIISQKPELLLIDEIIHMIDAYIRELFLEALIELINDVNTTIIMVNHTFSETGRIPERILIMEQGRFILDEKRENLNKKIKKIITNKEIEEDIPVLFKKESSIQKEFYIYPFKEEFNSKYKYDFQDINLTEIIKSFIGGCYAKKRV